MSKTRARVLNVASVFNAVDAIFQDSTGANEFLVKQSQFLLKRIQTQTRSGKDLSREGKKQPSLSPGYVRWRQRLQSGEATNRNNIVPDTSFFRPSFSNLTLTGQLLESLQAKVMRRNKEFRIDVSGKRDDGLTNRQVAGELKDRGRTFLGMDTKGIKVLRKNLIDEIRRQIKKKKFT